MLYQMHIIDSNAIDPILQNIYIANALLNPQRLSYTFYIINLLLKH